MMAGRGGRIVAALLAGCTGSTGAVFAGPGTFRLSGMRAVLDGAARFCAEQGRAVRLLDLQPDGDPRTRRWPAARDATFRCVPAVAGVSRPATPPPAG